MAEKLHKWQEDFKLKEQLNQGDFEKLEMALVKMPNVITLLRNSGLSIAHGAYLRCAIQAGWIVEPECKVMTDDNNGERTYFYDGKDVNEMHPAVVQWIGQQVINRHDSILRETPKNL